MITAIIQELKNEQDAGNDLAEQLIARIDAHVRDLEILKAWVRDAAAARSMAFDAMLGVEAPQPAEAAGAPSAPQDEAA